MDQFYTLPKEVILMKRLVYLFLTFVLSACSQDVEKKEFLENKETVIKYGKLKGKDVELIYSSHRGRLALRIKTDSVMGEEELAFMKKEVEFLTSYHKEPVKLGKSDYIFEYGGGYPIWGPYSSHFTSEDGNYTNHKCLLFVEGVIIEDKTIKAFGSVSKGYYYPYSDNAGFYRPPF
jgi:hypothetical protein